MVLQHRGSLGPYASAVDKAAVHPATGSMANAFIEAVPEKSMREGAKWAPSRRVDVAPTVSSSRSRPKDFRHDPGWCYSNRAGSPSDDAMMARHAASNAIDCHALSCSRADGRAARCTFLL